MDSNLNELKKNFLTNTNRNYPNNNPNALFSDISPNNILSEFLNFSRLQSPQNFLDEKKKNKNENNK